LHAPFCLRLLVENANTMIEIFRDILWIGSVASIATGLWWVDPSASLVGTGIIVIASLVAPRRS